MRVLHHKVELTDQAIISQENRQISGCPPGAPSPVPFPSDNSILQQNRAGNCTDKMQEVADKLLLQALGGA